MPISQMIHTHDLTDKIVSLIETNLKTSMGLKIYQFGGLEYFPTPQALSGYIPAIFVKPQRVGISFRQLGRVYSTSYDFRLVYINKFTGTDKPIELKCDKSREIAELFMNDLSLGSLALTNGTIEYVEVTGIEMEPIEDDFVYSLKADIYAVALTLKVHVITEA